MVERDALCPINAFRGHPLFPSYVIPFTSELYKSLTTHNGKMFLNIKCIFPLFKSVSVCSLNKAHLVQ